MLYTFSEIKYILCLMSMLPDIQFIFRVIPLSPLLSVILFNINNVICCHLLRERVIVSHVTIIGGHSLPHCWNRGMVALCSSNPYPATFHE